ncbi:MAG: hypothetical protein PVG39_26335 [Desulfobacteraceae bacterium]|jgi:hypothetical protein
MADLEKRVALLEKVLAGDEVEEDVFILRYVGDYSKNGTGEEGSVLSAVTIAGRVNGPPGFTLNRLEGETEAAFIERFEGACGQSLNMS